MSSTQESQNASWYSANNFCCGHKCQPPVTSLAKPYVTKFFVLLLNYPNWAQENDTVLAHGPFLLTFAQPRLHCREKKKAWKKKQGNMSKEPPNNRPVSASPNIKTPRQVPVPPISVLPLGFQDLLEVLSNPQYNKLFKSSEMADNARRYVQLRA